MKQAEFDGYKSIVILFFSIICPKQNRKKKINHKILLSRLGSISAVPENITVTFLNPTSVKILWQTSADAHAVPVDKYDVTYKPTDARYKN